MKDFEKVFGTKEQIKTSIAVVMTIWLVLLIANLLISIFVPIATDIIAFRVMAVAAAIFGIIYAILDWCGW